MIEPINYLLKWTIFCCKNKVIDNFDYNTIVVISLMPNNVKKLRIIDLWISLLMANCIKESDKLWFIV
jgi:hypothetical protein